MTRAEKLIKKYTEARERILLIIQDENTRGTAPAYLRRQLRRINAELARLAEVVRKESRAIVWDEYLKALSRAAIIAGVSTDLLQGWARQRAAVTEAGLPQQYPSVDDLIYSTRQNALEAVESVGRRVRDVVRETNQRAVMGLMTGEFTTPQARDALIKELIVDSEGIGGIKYKNGAIMPFEKYAEMVLRTTPREATNVAAIDAALFAGSNVVKMTKYFPTCPICAPRQGRVYRLVDFPPGDERNAFPHVSNAFPGWPEYPTVHPHCRHNLTVFILDTKSDDEKRDALNESQKPFNRDPRSENEIRKYVATQTVNRKRNADRNQFERYRAVIGAENMPTLAGWRRMKAADSERYRDLLADYRKLEAQMRENIES